MFELMFLGAFVGVLSGFFGIGGGTILVPILMLFGFETKTAIGISVVQMVFSSIFGSYLNHKKGTLDVAMISFIGFGGFSGALLSGSITAYFDSSVLEAVFLCFAIFALLRLFLKPKEHKEQREVNKILLFLIGLILGAVSITIGVGGGIVLIPLLVGFLHVPLKKATSAGLFFVIFSSVSGLISHSLNGNIDYESGIIIGLSSLFGVYIGIMLKDKVDVRLQRQMLVAYYLLIVLYLIKRIYF